MSERIIHKGNVLKGAYEIRIEESEGKEKVDEIIAMEKEREEFLNKVVYKDQVCNYNMAEIIYDNIGPWKSFNSIFEKARNGKFCVDGKIIIIEDLKIISIESKDERKARLKAWGQRISRIAREVGTSFEIATIVGKIKDDEIAIEILKIVDEKLKSDDFKAHMNQFYYSKYNIDDTILRNGIRDFLFLSLISYCSTKKLNMSNKFCKAVKKILNNK